MIPSPVLTCAAPCQTPPLEPGSDTDNAPPAPYRKPLLTKIREPEPELLTQANSHPYFLWPELKIYPASFGWLAIVSRYHVLVFDRIVRRWEAYREVTRTIRSPLIDLASAILFEQNRGVGEGTVARTLLQSDHAVYCRNQTATSRNGWPRALPTVRAPRGKWRLDSLGLRSQRLRCHVPYFPSGYFLSKGPTRGERSTATPQDLV